MRHINLGKTKYHATVGLDVKCTAHRCVNEYLGGGVGWICTTQTHLTGSHFGCVDERQRSRPSDCSLEGNHFPSMKTKKKPDSAAEFCDTGCYIKPGFGLIDGWVTWRRLIMETEKETD